MKQRSLVSRGLSVLRRIKRALNAQALKVRRFFARRALAGRRLHVRELAEHERASLAAVLPESNSRPSVADIAQQRAGKIGIVVAWNGAAPLGLGFVHWPGPRSVSLARRWPGTPEIYRLRVAPRYRSMGVGELLIRHVETMAAGKGYARVGLGVHEDNERAQALYTRLGYEPDAEPFLDQYVVTLANGRVRSVTANAIFLVKAVGAGQTGQELLKVPDHALQRQSHRHLEHRQRHEHADQADAERDRKADREDVHLLRDA